MKDAEIKNAKKIAEFENTIIQLQKLVKDQERDIEERDLEIQKKRQAFETKNEAYEAMVKKNHELSAEILDLKEYINYSKSAFEDRNSEENCKNLWEVEKVKYETEISKLQAIIVGYREKATSGTEKNYEEEIAKFQIEIDRLKKANIELQTKVQQHGQNVDRLNPFLHPVDNGIYPKIIDYNAADLRKYVTMADVVVKSDINYYQLKEKILIVQNLESDPNGDYMSECWYAENKKICLKNAIFKLFLDGELHVTKELEAAPLFNHIFYCNLTVLELNEQSLSYLEFMKLISSGTIKVLKFSKVYVEAKNGKKALEIDEILKNLKKLEKVEFRLTEYADSDKPSMTRGTAKKLGELERFQFLRKFEIHNLPSTFDRHAFGKFMNKHPNVQFIYSNINADDEIRLTKLEKCKRRLINHLQ